MTTNMREFIINFVSSPKYVIHFHTGQPKATAKDSANGVVGDIAAAGASASWNIANFVLDGCWVTHAGANLQGVGNVGDKAWPLYTSTTGPGSSGRFANAVVATTQSHRMPNNDADQINDEGRQTDPLTNKRAKVSKWAVSEAASASLVGKQLKRSCKSNDFLDGDRFDVDELTRRDLNESDDK